MTNPASNIRPQYQNARNLNARIAIHANYSTNTYGWQQWIFDHIELPDTARILELGCGPAGLWTTNRHRIPVGWRLVLTDFSPGMVATAQGNLAPQRQVSAYAVVDALSAPFEDRAFSGVIANHMLYHVPDRDRALVEVRRVLKPEGILFATTVGECHMREMWDLLEPFVPDIHTRVSHTSQGFTLENGGEQLRRIFGNVERYDYPDALEVTEVSPIIDYIRSSTTLVGCDLTHEQSAAIRRQIVAHLDLKGAFHIQKASGLFIARV